jgi:hypothetical protein
MDFAILAASGVLAVLVIRMLLMRARVQTNLIHDLDELRAAHEGFISKLDGLERVLADISGPTSEVESGARESDADMTWTVSAGLLILGHPPRAPRYKDLDDLVTEWPSTRAGDGDLEEDDGSYIPREPFAVHAQ